MKEFVVPAEEFKRRLIEKEFKKSLLQEPEKGPALVYSYAQAKERRDRASGGDAA